jgi:preprotein translocase subunit SecA
MDGMVHVMTLLENWRGIAYETQRDQKNDQLFWGSYFNQEREFYKVVLASEEVISGTVKELAEKFQVELLIMVGILDGINDSLKEKNPIETMEEDTVVSLDFDKEQLYKNMVECKAEWLYTLPEWDALLTEERRKELYKEQKSSTTIVKPKKIGRNDPCPCGSGKKYKQCCGK